MEKQIVSFQNEAVSLPVYMLDPVMPENLNPFGKLSYNRDTLENLRVIDDAMFTALDMAGGQMTWDEAAVSLGKKAAVSVATSYISRIPGAGAAASTALGVAKSAAITVGKQVLSNAANGLADSIQYRSGGNWGFDANTLKDRMVGKDALVGYLASGASSVVSGMIGTQNMFDNNGNALEAGTFNTRGIQALNAFAGSAVSTGITYGLTGAATLNVANFSDLTGGRISGGFMEMHLGGRDGFSMGIGSAGADVSFGNLAAVASGLKTTNQIMGFKRGGVEGQSSLAAINGLAWSGHEVGQEGNSDLASKLFNRELGIEWGDGIDQKGEAYNGFYEQGSNSITINRSFLGLGNEKAAQFAALLGHEGTHVNGNRYEGIAHRNGMNTYDTLSDMWSGVGDDAFYASMEAGYNDEASWTENTGSRDNWKLLILDGKLKVEYEKDKIDSFTFGDEILTSPLVSIDERKKLTALEEKSFSQLTDEEKKLVTDVTSRLTQTPEMTIAQINQNTTVRNNELTKLISFGKATRTVLDEMIANEGMNGTGKPSVSYGSWMKSFDEFNGLGIIAETVYTQPDLAGREYLDDDKEFIRPFDLPRGVKSVTTLSGIRFDPFGGTQFGGSVKDRLGYHNDYIDISGFGNRRNLYMHGNNGSATYSEMSSNSGLRVVSTSGSMENDMGHLGSGSIYNILDLWSSQGTTVGFGKNKKEEYISMTLNGLKQGSVIGQIGNTGSSSGRHIHGGVKINNVSVDPITAWNIPEGSIAQSARMGSGYPVNPNSLTSDDYLSALNYTFRKGTKQEDSYAAMNSFLGHYQMDYTVFSAKAYQKNPQAQAYFNYCKNLELLRTGKFHYGDIDRLRSVR